MATHFGNPYNPKPHPGNYCPECGLHLQNFLQARQIACSSCLQYFHQFAPETIAACQGGSTLHRGSRPESPEVKFKARRKAIHNALESAKAAGHWNEVKALEKMLSLYKGDT